MDSSSLIVTGTKPGENNSLGNQGSSSSDRDTDDGSLTDTDDEEDWTGVDIDSSGSLEDFQSHENFHKPLQ